MLRDRDYTLKSLAGGGIPGIRVPARLQENDWPAFRKIRDVTKVTSYPFQVMLGAYETRRIETETIQTRVDHRVQ